MDRKLSSRFKVLLSASIAAIASVVTAQVAMQEHRPLDLQELKIGVADIQSFAAEGSFLATQQIGASVTQSYANVQTEMWRRKIDELARKYESREPEPNLAQVYAEECVLADRLHVSADEVARRFTQHGSARTVAAHLQEIESQARTLTSRLERELH